MALEIDCISWSPVRCDSCGCDIDTSDKVENAAKLVFYERNYGKKTDKKEFVLCQKCKIEVANNLLTPGRREKL